MKMDKINYSHIYLGNFPWIACGPQAMIEFLFERILLILDHRWEKFDMVCLIVCPVYTCAIRCTIEMIREKSL